MSGSSTGGSGNSRRTGSRRVEAFFSRLGLAAFATLVPVGLLLIDVVAPGPGTSVVDPTTETFHMALVAHDGRDIGGDPEGGAELVLSPATFYENRPNQESHGINAFGLRGPACAPTPDRPRVVVVGGSAAFGLGVGEEATFVAALRRRNPDIEFLNGGVVGYLSLQELCLVVYRVLDLQPDVIVAFNGWNNLYDNYWWAVLGDGEMPHHTANSNFVSMENRLVRYRRIQQDPWAALVEAGRTAARRSWVLSTVARLTRPQVRSRDVPEFDPDRTARVATDYATDMLKLDGVARSFGSRLVVVVQPEVTQVADLATVRGLRAGLESDDFLEGDRYWASFPSLYRAFRQQTTRMLSARGVTVLDGSALLARTTRGPEAPGLFLDPVHLGPAGHARMAQVLERPIREALARRGRATNE